MQPTSGIALAKITASDQPVVLPVHNWPVGSCTKFRPAIEKATHRPPFKKTLRRKFTELVRSLLATPWDL